MLNEFNPDFHKLINGESSSFRFEEYGRFSQHVALLEDYGRVRAYLEALSRAPQRSGVVLDVGAGTGIWGLVALKCGFDHAYLVEPSRKMCEYCQHIASVNGLSQKVTILNTTAEKIDLNILPRSLDLIVTETISSLLFGFGSWDVLPALADRLKERSNIVPFRGKLFAAMTHREFGKLQGKKSGVWLIESLGITMDISRRAFHSSGNVLEKGEVLWAIAQGEINPVCLASFDFAKEDGRPRVQSARVQLRPEINYRGLLLYWTLDLNCWSPNCHLSSLDPEVSSWYPLYVPLNEPIVVDHECDLAISLIMEARDYPYKYSFLFMADGKAITSTLYW